MTVHPSCGKTWTGLAAQHCAACCETFIGTAAGDLHRRGPFGRRKCVPEFLLPAIGLKRDPRGVWGTTGKVPADNLAAWRTARSSTNTQSPERPAGVLQSHPAPANP